MESTELRKKLFAPVSRAFSDAVLQLRAKPLVFLLIWLVLGLAPQLLLSFAFQAPVSGMVDMSYDIIAETMASGETTPILSSDMSDTLLKGLRAVVFMMVILAITAIYLGSVLAAFVGRFRERGLPTLSSSFRDGLNRFPDFFKAVFFAAYKILLKPVVVFIVGTIIGSLIGQPGFIYFFFLAAGILFLMGLLRFGLSPFIHLSLGIRGREASSISKLYYMSHRPVVSILFIFTILLPIVLISILMNSLIMVGLFSGTGGLLLGILQSLIQLSMIVVTINFAMNNFLPQDWGIGKTSGALDIPDESV